MVQKRRQTARITDVAARARVSKTTAAYILAKREPYFSRYAAATIERVRRAAKELDYSRNLFASSLRSQRSPLLATYFDFDSIFDAKTTYAMTQYLWHVFAGVTQAAAERRVFPLLVARSTVGDPEEAVRELHDIGGVPLLGLVAFARSMFWQRVFDDWDADRVPCIGIFGVEADTTPHYRVDTDNAEVGRLAAQALVARGHRRLDCVRESDDGAMVRLRIDGFCREARRLGAEATVWQIPSIRKENPPIPRSSDEVKSRALGRLWASHTPKAVFAPSGGLTVTVDEVLRALGVPPPEQTALVGIDVPVELSLVHRIVQIGCPGYDIGYAAADLLFERIGGVISAPCTRLVVPRVLSEPLASDPLDPRRS